MDNVTINFRDLMMRIFLKWRLILVCLVLGAIALNFFGVYRAQKHRSARQPDAEVTVESLAQKLSEENLEEALENRALYSGLYNAMNGAREYIENSVKMHLDPNAVPTMRIRVYVETEDPAIVRGILLSTGDHITGGEMLESVAQILGDMADPSYAHELINVMENSWNKEFFGNVFDVHIIARSENECRRITDLILAKLEEIEPELRDTCGEFSFHVLSTEYSEVADINLLSSMRDTAKTAQDTSNSYYNFANTLSADQLAYLDALEHGLDKEDPDSGAAAPESSGRVSLVRPKYILVGAVLGAFCAVVYVFCALIFGGKLITAEDLSESAGIPSLGALRVSRKPRGLDRWLYRVFGRSTDKYSPEESLEIILAGIRIAAAKNGWKNVFLTSSSNDEETKNTLAILTEKLKEQVANVSCGRPVIHDPAAMEAMSSSDAAVLVERVDVSRYADVNKTLSLCKQYHVPVAGYVAQV